MLPAPFISLPVQGKILPVKSGICWSNGIAFFLLMLNFVCSVWLHLSKIIAKHVLSTVMKRQENVTSARIWILWIWTQVHSKLPPFVVSYGIQASASQFVEWIIPPPPCTPPPLFLSPFSLKKKKVGWGWGVSTQKSVGRVTLSTVFLYFYFGLTSFWSNTTLPFLMKDVLLAYTWVIYRAEQTDKPVLNSP